MTLPVSLSGFRGIRFPRFGFPLLMWLALGGAVAAADQTVPSAFDIAGAPADQALKQFSQQSGQEVLFSPALTRGVRTQPVKGTLAPAEALDRLLAGTGLVAVRDEVTGTVSVRRAPAAEPKNVPSRPERNRTARTADGVLKLETFEVMDSRLLNMDIRRTREDAQPYVTFDRTALERSGAPNLDEFLKQRLTMNTTSITNAQFGGGGITGAFSQVNLRGLGANKTLILIDGHRTSGPSFNNSPGQTNLNSIPLAAVERIEVLPATSAGIYGGSATGGVVNIILRRDYTGSETRLTYDNSFQSDTSIKRVDFGAGWSSAAGRTHLFLSGSYSDGNGLETADRSFLQTARARILANNPGFVLTASAPPQGRTPNIASSNGSNLVLKDGTPLNSPITFVPAGYGGAATDGGAALVANAGRYNFDLSPTARAGFGTPSDLGGKRALLQATTLRSLIGTVRHQFLPRLEAYVSVMASDQHGGSSQFNSNGRFTLPANAATNPFQQAIVVQTPNPQFASEATSLIEGLSVNAGSILKLQGDLLISVDYGWNRSTRKFDWQNGTLSTAASTAVSSGSIDVVRDPARFFTDFSSYLMPVQYTVKPFENLVETGAARFAKPVLQLSSGPVTLSGLIEYREDILREASYFSAPSTVTVFPHRSQSIESAYLETKVPLVGPANRVPFVERLELQVAGRHDRYQVNGVTGTYSQAAAATTPIMRVTNRLHSSDYTLGLSYSPHADLALRASLGSGFQPPMVDQLVPRPPLDAPGGLATDPRRGNEPVGPVKVTLGGNPGLLPEKSKSVSAGFILSPTALPGLRWSVDYVQISQRGLIGAPDTTIFAFLPYENLFPTRIIRAPVAPGDPYGVGPITGLDITSTNLGQVDVEAYDVAVDYARTQESGTWTLAAAATWQTSYDVQLVDGQPFINSVGVGYSRPLRFKGNASVSWSRGPWSAGLTLRYFDSYLVANPALSTNADTIRNQGNGGEVPSQRYYDLYCGYKTGGGRSAQGVRSSLGTVLFQNTELQVGIRNVFNAKPPFDAASADTSYYSSFGDPRLSSYWASVKKAF